MQRTPLNTLIVAAHAAELTPWVNLGRRHFRICGDTAFLSAGVGPVAAAFGLTHFLEDFRPGRIIGVGTAGVINTDKFRAGDVVVARSVTTDSGCGDVYTPAPQPANIVLQGVVILRPKAEGSPNGILRPPSALRSAGLRAPKLRGSLRRSVVRPSGCAQDDIRAAHVFAPQEISRTDARREALQRSGFDVEHLESFAFAFVAEKFRCPITIVLGLANVVGPKAHAEWRVNSERVMKRVAKAVAP